MDAAFHLGLAPLECRFTLTLKQITDTETSARHILSMEEILSLYKERVRYVRLAFSFVRDYSVAEDIFGDAVFRLVEKREGLYVSDARAFFMVMIKNRCLDYLKSGAFRSSASGIVVGQDAMMKEDVAILSAAVADGSEASVLDFPEMMEECKRRLSDVSYEVFLAKRLDGMSYKEISLKFGIPESRINYEMKLAQKVFREVFKDYNLFSIVLPLVCRLFSQQIF